jgi:hypothetical protein
LIALYPAKPQFKYPKAPVDSAPSVPLVDIRQPRSSISVSTDPEVVVNEGPQPQKASPLHGPNLEQTTPRRGVAASPKPSDEGADGDLGFHKPVGGGSQTTSVQPAVQHVGVRGSTGLILPDIVPTLSPQSTPPFALSAGSAPPSFHNNNQPTSFSQYVRPPHLRESFTVCFASFIIVDSQDIEYGPFCRRRSNENRNRQVSLLRPLMFEHFPGFPNARPPLEVLAMCPQNRRLWTSTRRRWTYVPSRSTGPLGQARFLHD